MNNKSEILSNIKSVCEQAMGFLHSQKTSLDDKQRLIDETKALISEYKLSGYDTSELQGILSGFEKELMDIQDNKSDLIKENLFIIELTEALRNFSGWSNNGYKTQKQVYDDNLLRKETIEKANKEYEDLLSSIDEENDEKSEIRSKIVQNENFLSEMNKSFLSFEGLHKEKINSLSVYDKNIKGINSEIESLNSDIEELDFEIESGFKAFDGVHKDYVDTKLSFNSISKQVQELGDVNKTYGTSSIELKESVSVSDEILAELEKMSSKEREIEAKLDELKDSKSELVKKLREKESELDMVNSEKSILESTNNSKDLDIKTLDGKLQAWNINYKEFKTLVNDLAKKVGYPKYLNMDGDEKVEGENPLISLIEQVKNITTYVERADLAKETGIKITEEGQTNTKEEAKSKVVDAKKSLPTKSKMRSLFSKGEVKANEPYWVEDSDEPIVFNEEGDIEEFVQEDPEKEIEIKYIVVEKFTPPVEEGFDIKPYLIGAAATFGLISVMRR